MSLALSCLLLAACAPSNRTLAALARHGAIQVDARVKAASTVNIHAPPKSSGASWST